MDFAHSILSVVAEVAIILSYFTHFLRISLDHSCQFQHHFEAAIKEALVLDFTA
jgi:hypothetical protein